MQRFDLAVQVYDYLYENTQSFEEDNIGADLAYLMAAILKEVQVEFGIAQPIVRILDQGFPREHALWTYIELTGLHTDGRIPSDEEMKNATSIAAKPDAVARLLGASHYKKVRCVRK